jgi:hypothetical protein
MAFGLSCWARQLRRADILHLTAQGKRAVLNPDIRCRVNGETCLNPKPICCL